MNGFMYVKSRFFDRTASFNDVAIMIDPQNVSSSHLAPVHAPTIDEKGAVTEGMAEVVVNAFMQILARLF